MPAKPTPIWQWNSPQAPLTRDACEERHRLQAAATTISSHHTRKRSTAKRWLGILLLGLVGAAVALTDPVPQTPHPLPEPAEARLRRVDTQLGLSQDSALALAQDRRGWIWIGTQDGLNRFDGYAMRSYRAEANVADSLGSNWINALSVDGEGSLWVGSNNGLFRYDADRDGFRPYAVSELGRGRGFVYALARDHDRLWIGHEAGLSVWKTDQAEEPLPTWPLPTGTASPRVRAIAADGLGNAWLGTPVGLFYFDGAQARIHAASEPLATALGARPINALLQDRQRRLWIGTDDAGVLCYDPADRSLRRFGRQSSPALHHDRVHALYETDDGSVWIGSEVGAYRIEPNVPLSAEPRMHWYRHRPHDPQSLGQGRVPSFMQDRDGTLWIGTWEGGAARLSPHYSRLQSYHGEAEVTSALADSRVLAVQPDGSWLWLGTSSGLFRFHTHDLRIEAEPAVAHDTLFALARGKDSLWIGSGEGLLQFDLSDHTLRNHSPAPELAGARVRRLMLDPDRLWLFAELHGLYVLSLPNLEVEAVHRFPGNVYNLNRLSRDAVLVSASDGLHWFNGDGSVRLRTIPVDPGDSSGQALPAPPTAVLHDDAGALYVASYGAGLFRLQLLDPSPEGAVQLHAVTLGKGLSNQGLNSALRDSMGRFWLATDRGVSRFDPQRNEVINYDASDGAFARGYYFSAAASLDDGRLAFGSKDGFTLVDPRDDAEPTAPPPPVLTALERQGEILAPKHRDPNSPLQRALHRVDELSLAPGTARNLGIHFASPDFISPHRLNYYYRLRGWDEGWIRVGPDRRLATYTLLPPGSYVFEVSAENERGLRSEPTRLTLQVLPHWWQTVWARALGLFALIALTTLLYRWRIRQLRQYRNHLERVVEQRTRALSIAKRHAEDALSQLQSTQQELVRAEKLSALGQLVAGVAHEVNTPLGVALTASSHLSQSVLQLQASAESGKLGRGEFDRFVSSADEGCAMIQRNLERAAELVRNFKQVSVDRSSDGRRRFDLREALCELTQSLKLLWKPRAIELDIDCPDDIEMDSFPGALGQVLTNLAQNALQHGFHERQQGRMQIRVRKLDAERIELIFEDNGRGIPSSDLGRIFEPFYTTGRDRGGTGLGLHIVHNLVREKLGGSLSVRSEVGCGSEFVLNLPRTAPEICIVDAAPASADPTPP